MPAEGSRDESVLLVAPVGQDAPLITRLLERVGLGAIPCRDLVELCQHFQNGAGALLIAEEALDRESRETLLTALHAQAKWSDIPIILLTSNSHSSDTSLRMFAALAASGNVTLLERPVRQIVLTSALTAALKARRRQYEIRDFLIERERHLLDLEQRVEERTAALTETNRQMESFCYTVSHDLRAPLRAMSGFADLLLEDFAPGLGPDGAKYLERIKAAAVKMGDLTNDLLNYSRTSRIALVMQPLPLDEVVDEVVASCAFQIHESGTQVVREKLLHCVMGHRESLVQALTNLVINATKFTRPGVLPEIRFRSEDRGQMIRLWIIDNGIGIEPRFQSRIFNIFEKLHGEDYGGTGVGLAIVSRVVERLHGRTGVESDGATGSQFWIELPAGPPLQTGPPSSGLPR